MTERPTLASHARPPICSRSANIEPARPSAERREPQSQAPQQPSDVQCSRREFLPLAGAACASLWSTGGAEAAIDDVRSTYDAAAASYDGLDGGLAADLLGFSAQRRKLVARASGRVLEVAVGTGINLPLYDWTAITAYTGLDLSSGMLAQAQGRLQTLPPGPERALQEGNVEALPFSDASFDTVLCTFSLCVFPKPAASLRELRRVLRPDGRLLLLEHSRSSFPLLALYQDATAGVVAATARGCVWNQDVPALLREAGLQPLLLERSLAGLITLTEAVPV